jgi:hypothetical protein
MRRRSPAALPLSLTLSPTKCGGERTRKQPTTFVSIPMASGRVEPKRGEGESGRSRRDVCQTSEQPPRTSPSAPSALRSCGFVEPQFANFSTRVGQDLSWHFAASGPLCSPGQVLACDKAARPPLQEGEVSKPRNPLRGARSIRRGTISLRQSDFILKTRPRFSSDDANQQWV